MIETWQTEIQKRRLPVITILLGASSIEVRMDMMSGENVRGYPCTPCMVGRWKDVYEEKKIARNGTDGSHERDRLSALTQKSFLVCAYGGLIEPWISGQEEE